MSTTADQPPLPLPEFEEGLSLAEFAHLAGVTYSTVKMYMYRGECRFPEPDASIISERTGKVLKKRWRRSTVESWVAQRPGRGQYDRATARRSERTGETKPRTRGGRANCPICKLPVEITVGAKTFRAHGPRNNRCRGTGQPLAAWPGTVVKPRSTP